MDAPARCSVSAGLRRSSLQATATAKLKSQPADLSKCAGEEHLLLPKECIFCVLKPPNITVTTPPLFQAMVPVLACYFCSIYRGGQTCRRSMGKIYARQNLREAKPTRASLRVANRSRLTTTKLGGLQLEGRVLNRHLKMARHTRTDMVQNRHRRPVMEA